MAFGVYSESVDQGLRRRSTPAMAPTPRYISLADAAEMLAVSPQTVRRYISLGQLPAYRIGAWQPGGRGGRVIRVKVEDVEKLLRRIPTMDPGE